MSSVARTSCHPTSVGVYISYSVDEVNFRPKIVPKSITGDKQMAGLITQSQLSKNGRVAKTRSLGDGL